MPPDTFTRHDAEVARARDRFALLALVIGVGLPAMTLARLVPAPAWWPSWLTPLALGTAVGLTAARPVTRWAQAWTADPGRSTARYTQLFVGTWLAGLAAAIRARPVVRAMALGDYDHDGRATEFLLQVGTMPCGKRYSVLVGVSRADSALHVFRSVGHPERPLVLPTDVWERLRQSAGEVVGVEWPCGDHGAGTEPEVRVRAGPAGIDGVRTAYACGGDTVRGRRLSSERL